MYGATRCVAREAKAAADSNRRALQSGKFPDSGSSIHDHSFGVAIEYCYIYDY